MKKQHIIDRTIQFVQQTLEGAEGGHDWFHTHRVFKNAQQIAEDENVDSFIVAISALLHDIADSKFYNGDETIGPKKARAFMQTMHVDEDDIEHVVKIIENISFKASLYDENGNFVEPFQSRELDVVQDADRLDAIGAIGIARCFNYGGFKNRVIYDPNIEPNLNMTREEYKHSCTPTLNHFYEKLLLLKDRMNTKTGTQLAKQRHKFMEQYLEEFYDEWNGKK